MAVANSLSAVLSMVQGRWNAQLMVLGERAGNASLEEIVMAVKTRKDIFNFETNN
jgi:2-isopropylmalate synthase